MRRLPHFPKLSAVCSDLQSSSSVFTPLIHLSQEAGARQGAKFKRQPRPGTSRVWENWQKCESLEKNLCVCVCDCMRDSEIKFISFSDDPLNTKVQRRTYSLSHTHSNRDLHSFASDPASTKVHWLDVCLTERNWVEALRSQTSALWGLGYKEQWTTVKQWLCVKHTHTQQCSMSPSPCWKHQHGRSSFW